MPVRKATPLAWLSGGIAFLTGIAYWAIPPGPEEAWLELRLPDRDPVNPSAFLASASRRHLRMGVQRNRLTLAFGLYLLLVPVPSWQGIAFPWSTAIGTIRLFGALVIALALWTLRVLPAAIASGVWDLVLLPGGIFWPSRLRAWLIP